MDVTGKFDWSEELNSDIGKLYIWSSTDLTSEPRIKQEFWASLVLSISAESCESQDSSGNICKGISLSWNSNFSQSFSGVWMQVNGSFVIISDLYKGLLISNSDEWEHL